MSVESANETSVRAFLVDAAARGVHFHLDGGALKSRAPAGAITEAMGAFVRARKTDVVACLAAGFVPPSGGSGRLVPRGVDAPEGRLSLAQERFWFINELTGDSPLYNMPVALRIRGRFDAQLAEQALQRIVDRHAPLHHTYSIGPDGAARQQPCAAGRRFELGRLDLSGLPADAQAARVAEEMHASAGRPFDLGRDLMLRGTHLTLSADEGILLLCVHHIAADGWSFRVMELEFVEHYHALREGKPDPLPPLRITYADYVEWQRGRLEADATGAELAYWERQLADLPTVHALPLDRPRAAGRGQPGARHGFMLAPALFAAVKRLALAQGCTPFMVLHAAFALLLSRWSGERDIVLGTPVLNRLDHELERLVGCFVNSLVLRVDCAPELALPAFLQQVKAVNLDAQTHQEITFEQIVDRLNPPRSPLYSPLFQIMFSMGMPQETAHRKLPDIALSQLEHEGTVAKFDLSLYAQETDGELYFGVEYDRGLFEAATIERLSAHFRGLLAAMVATPEVTLAELSLLGTDAIDAEAFVDGGPAVEISDCLHEGFERQCDATPEALAIMHDGAAWTYAELDARANRLARHLRELGVGPDVRVGVCLGRSCALALAILAVWKAGGAYVPLDPAHPPARLAAMLADAQATLVLTDTASSQALATDATSLCLDEASLQSTLALVSPARLPRATLTPAHLAYVIFTSGSTGRPKGVMVEHRQAGHLAHALRPWLRAAGIPAACRWAWNASPAFDASLQALLQWHEGATLHLLGDDVRRDPAALAAYLHAHAIDVLDATPLQVEGLLEVVGTQPLPALVIGGEAIAPALWQRLGQQFAGGPHRALNVYGPTEATVDATAALIEGERPHIGRPLAGVRAHVVDAHGRPQLVGVPGELLLSGAGLARGYAGDDALTETKFTVLPKGERAYRTGDRVRLRDDGQLEFLGRLDAQLKVRGHRIEPGEIEHALRAVPGVSAAAVMPFAAADGAIALAAYVVVADEDIERVRAALRASLPEVMVPARLIALAKLPMTASGKLDRAALPLPVIGPARGVAARLPTRPCEQLVADVWAEQLRVPAVGLDDDFFELGGHSVLAARVVSRLASVFQARVPLRRFFEQPTVAGLVRVLSEASDLDTLDAIAEVYASIAGLDHDQVRARLAAEGAA